MSRSAESTSPLLRFRSRGGFERTFEVDKDEFVIGSRGDADIRVGVLGVPRDACTLELDDEGLRITRVGPGVVQVDSQPAAEGQALEVGCTLQVGPAVFTFEMDAES